MRRPATPRQKKMRDTLIDVVCDVMNMHRNTILSKRRDQRTTMARHIVMWGLYKLTDASTTQIGWLMNRDHASVVYAIAEVYDNIKMPYHKELRQVINRIIEKGGASGKIQD